MANQDAAYYSRDTYQTNQTGSTSSRDILPTIESLFNVKETKDGGKEYELFGCKLTLSKDDCLFAFAPASAECKVGCFFFLI